METEGVVIQLVRLTHGPDAGTPTHGRIRAESGRSVFLHPSDCLEVPELFDRVAFTWQDTPRGPRAVDVQIVAKYQPPATPFVDRTLGCRVCFGLFTWTAHEQEVFYAAGLKHQPSACQPCRAQRREEKRARW